MSFFSSPMCSPNAISCKLLLICCSNSSISGSPGDNEVDGNRTRKTCATSLKLKVWMIEEDKVCQCLLWTSTEAFPADLQLVDGGGADMFAHRRLTSCHGQEWEGGLRWRAASRFGCRTLEVVFTGSKLWFEWLRIRVVVNGKMYLINLRVF